MTVGPFPFDRAVVAMGRFAARANGKQVGLLLAVAMLIATSVAGPSSALSKPAPVAPVSGWTQLPADLASVGWAAVVDGEHLWLSEPDGTFHVAAAAPPGGYLADPAWRPGGGSVAYARFTPIGEAATPAGGGTRFVGDLWATDRDGIARLLVSHDAPDTLLSRPVWTSDGSAIVYVRSGFAQQGGVKRLVRQIEKRELATGAPTILVDDGDWPTLSPDDELLAFVRSGPTGRADLWVRDLTRGVERQLTRGQYASLTSPRFSPDGQVIAFGGALFVPKRGVAGMAPVVGRLGAWLVPTAEAHELLDRLWLVNRDGSRLRRVGELALDGITVRWAGDSDRVLIWDEDGLYRLNVVSTEHALVLRPGSYHGFDWLPTASD